MPEQGQKWTDHQGRLFLCIYVDDTWIRSIQLYGNNRPNIIDGVIDVTSHKAVKALPLFHKGTWECL